MGFDAEKSIIRQYIQTLNEANAAQVTKALAPLVSENWHWMSYFPFDDQYGAKAVCEVFWTPYLNAFRHVARREDIFFAGKNEIDGFQSTWVVSMGHLMGLFDAPWLGIRPTGRLAFLRFCEFHRVENGKIQETAFYCDIPHLMMQAGQNPFPPQTGAHLIQPGPAPHNGLLYLDAPVEDGEKTLNLINAMIGNLGTWQSGLSLEEELALNWHDDMLWWGPAGIGSTYTIARYAKQHSGPFRAAFTSRSKTTHRARLAEGEFGGFFGRPNFTAVHQGGFMGLPANDKPCEFRVIDIYRRRDDKLAENWVFIDILYWLHQQGVDVLERNKALYSEFGKTELDCS